MCSMKYTCVVCSMKCLVCNIRYACAGAVTCTDAGVVSSVQCGAYRVYNFFGLFSQLD